MTLTDDFSLLGLLWPWPSALASVASEAVPSSVQE
jgi:hypothetical protein